MLKVDTNVAPPNKIPTQFLMLISFKTICRSQSYLHDRALFSCHTALASKVNRVLWLCFDNVFKNKRVHEISACRIWINRYFSNHPPMPSNEYRKQQIYNTSPLVYRCVLTVVNTTLHTEYGRD